MSPTVALRLGRVSNLPTVWTNVLTGVVLCGGETSAARLLVLLAAMSFLYVAGMYLNDAFDHEFDTRYRPERPIPSGLVSVPAVFGAGFAMIAAALLLLLWLGYAMENGTAWRALAAGTALALAIVFYDWRHKDLALSPVIMGICRMLVYVTAGLTVSAVLPAQLLLAAVILLCYLIGLSYVAQQETLGRVRNLWPLIFLAAPFAYGLLTFGTSLTNTVVYVGFLAWVLFALSFLLRAGHINVPRAVVFLIAGISLLDAMLIAGQGQGTLAWIAVGGFALTLTIQRFIPGT